MPNSFEHFSLPWRSLPSAFSEDTELFAVGDVHGQSALLEQVLQEIRNIPREVPKRHVVFLGDLIDRGPASIEAVSLAVRAGELSKADNVHFLPGNHDLAMLLALEDRQNLDFWLRLGGDKVIAEVGLSPTKNSWKEIVATLQAELHPQYLSAVTSGPTHLYFGDLLFVHAGICPALRREDFLRLPRRSIHLDEHWSTIRSTFLTHTSGWDSGDLNPQRRKSNPTVVVHGHTPALWRNLTEAADLEVCDGIENYRTIALDIGAAYRRQMAFAHFRNSQNVAEVQIHAIRDTST